MRSPIRPRLLFGDSHAAAPAADGRPAALSSTAIVLMFLAVAGGIVLLSRGGGGDYVAVRQHVSSSLQSWRRMDMTRAQEPTAAAVQPGPAADASADADADADAPKAGACPPVGPAAAASPPEPIGFPACAGQAASILDAMAVEDKSQGWRHGGRPAMQQAYSGSHSAGGGIGATSGSRGGGGGAHSLVAIPTANVWARTELLLHSLAGNSDDFDVLVVDELSDDGTPQRLQDLGVKMLQPPERLGVTHNWNWAYREWLRNTSAEAFFISNNDVLLPDGVIDALAHALTPEGGDCDVVGPLSTVRGLGTWGAVEGLEVLYALTAPARAFASNPLNYQRVQVALRAAGCEAAAAVHAVADIQTKVPGLSGFFFGMRRGIQQWAFEGDQLLFDPAHRIIGQEGDLFHRAVLQPRAAGKPIARYCIHTGAFVFHYKGSTIPPEADREKWHLSPAKAAAMEPATATTESRTEAARDADKSEQPAAAKAVEGDEAAAGKQQPDAADVATAKAAAAAKEADKPAQPSAAGDPKEDEAAAGKQQPKGGAAASGRAVDPVAPTAKGKGP